MHDRHAERALLAGGMPVPMFLMAPYAVAMLQPRRDVLLRQGRVRPRNRREYEIFAQDLLGEPDGDDDRPEPGGR
jgi:hypothetical protein